MVGGTGAIGRAVIERTGEPRPPRAERGATCDRGGRPEVETRTADIMDIGAGQAGDRGRTVIYQCAAPEYTRWVEGFPTLRRTHDAANKQGRRLVASRTCRCTGRANGPLRETTPMDATGRKGSLRAHLSGDCSRATRPTPRVAMGRASDYFGPGGMNSAAGEQFFPAIAVGKGPHSIGRLDQPHALSYLHEHRCQVVTLGGHCEADGKVWRLPAARPDRGRMGGASGRDRRSRSAAVDHHEPMVVALGLFMPLLRELRETLYQWEQPWIVDDSKFREAFGRRRPMSTRAFAAHSAGSPARSTQPTMGTWEPSSSCWWWRGWPLWRAVRTCLVFRQTGEVRKPCRPGGAHRSGTPEPCRASVPLAFLTPIADLLGWLEPIPFLDSDAVRWVRLGLHVVGIVGKLYAQWAVGASWLRTSIR